MSFAINEYDVGEEVTSVVTFKKKDNSGVWNLADPTTVTFRFRKQSATVTTYVYVTDPQVVKISTGVYKCAFIPDSAGSWFYRWEASGNVNTAVERRVQVNPTNF